LQAVKVKAAAATVVKNNLMIFVFVVIGFCRFVL
jgi:hypothetical protein